jgi:glycerol uptake facilitator protein
MTEEYTLTQKAVAEFIGTFSIVFFGAGAVAIDLMTVPEGALGEGAAAMFTVDGLGLGTLGWVGIALAFFGAVAIPIYLLGHVSGQHINPAVTVAFWLTDRIETTPAAVYIGAQLAGGIAAGLVFVAIRGTEAVTVGGMGATIAFPGIAGWQAALNELVITFFLMVTIMAMAIDERTPDEFAGLTIGFIVAVGVLATGNISGASFNPARTVGPYVLNTLVAGDLAIWAEIWIYVLGPTVGAILGAYFYDSMVLDPIAEEQPPDEPEGGRAGYREDATESEAESNGGRDGTGSEGGRAGRSEGDGSVEN